jgi:hypothetical protein
VSGPVEPSVPSIRVRVMGELAKLAVRASGSGEDRFTRRQVLALDALVDNVWDVLLADTRGDE